MICLKCKRPLKNAVSIAMRMGPVCRSKQEWKGTNDMFTARAQYRWYMSDDILCIEDLGGAKSITNDMERILKEISSEQHCEGAIIIYRDSEGVWDGVRFRNGVVTFYSVNERDLGDALATV